MFDFDIFFMVKGCCIDKSGFVVVVVGIILLIIDDFEFGYGDFELLNNIGYNGKDCVVVLIIGFENVCEC